MYLNKDVHDLRNGHNVRFAFETPNFCPQCKCGIEPIFIDGCYKNDELAIQYFCNACNHSFVAKYSADPKVATSVLVDTFPKTHINRVFPSEIQKLSLKFCEIYNQASQAENMNLSEICGLGYRKSLEFLVKDFCILLHPDNEDEIKANHHVDQVIKKYLSEYPPIADISRVSFWFGNDEAHYTRQYSTDNLTNLKQYIDALVYTIQSVLVYGDAHDLLEEKYGNH